MGFIERRLSALIQTVQEQFPGEYSCYEKGVKWISGEVKSLQASVWEKILFMLQRDQKENITAEIFPSGWLSPEGNFIDVPYGDHERVAEKIIGQTGGEAQDRAHDRVKRFLHGEDPATILETDGYIRISCGVIHYNWLDNPHFSEEQILFLKNILKKSGREEELYILLDLLKSQK